MLPAGVDQSELTARFAPYRERLVTMPVPERRPFAFTWRFGTLEAPTKVPALQEIVSAWNPDVVIHESADLAAPIVASALGLPTVHHSFGRLVPMQCFERAADETAHLWRDVGLEPEPLCGAFRGVYVDICPPSFQAGGLPDGTTSQPERPVFPAAPGTSAPGWLDELSERPMVYITLGTVHNDASLFRLLLDAVADLDANVVMTVGRDNDPGLLAPIPPNAVVERYIPQSYVLPHASVVVAHGGSGSILATFAHGLPTLLVPQGADQFENAARCAELGAGLVLMSGDVTVAAVRDAVQSLLRERSYRERAHALATEIAAMPDPAEVAERLAARLAA